MGTVQVSSIISRINGVRGSIDPRVAARCSGFENLISSVENIAKELEKFSENIDNTIRFIKQLEEDMNSNFDLTTTLEQLSLLQQSGLNSKDVAV